MEDFWGPLRRRWPGGAARLHWHILPGGDPAIAALAAAYGELTARRGIDVVPARWLHQTLYMLGSAPGVTAAEADQMIRCVQAAARLWEPMRVTYGPAVISAQSVTLRVSSIGYANSAVDDGPLVSWLAGHPVEPVTVTVRAIHLVRQTYRDHMFSWEPLAAIPLGRGQ